MKIKVVLAIVFFWSASGHVKAQQQFSEGNIVYSVTIEKEPGAASQTGEFRIILKDKQFSKELSLSSGFNNRFLFNTEDNTIYSLRKVQGKKYAIQLNSEDFKKKQHHCPSVKVEDVGTESKTVAGYTGQRATALCPGTEPAELYYTKEWSMANTELFQNFGGFRYLPLIYDIRNDDGSTFHFVLKKIESKPVDNGAFRIPKDYKLLTNEEYNAITR